MSRLTIGLAAILFAATASAGDLAGGNAVQAPRVEAVGGSGLEVQYAGMVGSDRGVNVWTTRARVTLDQVHISASVPVASYPTGLGQDIDLGNIGLSAWYDLPYFGLNHSMGLKVHLPAGERAYAWQNSPEELWPGSGLDLLWQGRFGTNGTTLLLQGSLGIHESVDFAPFQDRWVRAGASAVLDRDLGNRFGVTGSLDMQYWDTTPIEMSVAGRADIVTGLRMRGGILFPIATWAGATPADRPAGIREATLFLSAGLAL